MIDVHANRTAVPFPADLGQRKPATDFCKFLELCIPEASGEAAVVARSPHAEEPRHAAIFPFPDDGWGEPGDVEAKGGRMGVIEVAIGDTKAGVSGSDSWPVTDDGATEPPIQVAPVEVCFAELESGCESGSGGSFVGSDVVVPIRDAPHVQMQAGPEREEWVFRPWRLHAGTGLSYRSGNSLPFQMDGNTFAAAADGPSGGEGKAPSLGSAGERVWPVLQENLPVVPAHGGAVPLIAGNGADGADPYAQAVIGSWNKGAWVHWAQRLLRWNAGATESENATAWVRDFSLDADEMPNLVASLRAFSAGQGIALSRIVVNGREAWVAAGYSQHQHMEREGDGR